MFIDITIYDNSNNMIMGVYDGNADIDVFKTYVNEMIETYLQEERKIIREKTNG